MAGSLGLLCAAPSPQPGQALHGGEDEWNKAVQAARADRAAADPDGTYFGVFVRGLAKVQGPALRGCRQQHPTSASASFQAVARLSKEETIQQLLLKPTSDFHRCVRDSIKATTLPRPPKAPYWIMVPHRPSNGPCPRPPARGSE
jgi:hypothetical protein